MISRDVVEHEAAHYVAARAFGVRVAEVEVVGVTAGKAGSCSYNAADWFPARSWGGLWLERCAAALAPQVWLKELAPKRLLARGVAADNETVRRVLFEALPPNPDPVHLNQLRRRAEDRAREVLGSRRDEVLAFADGLARHGYWTAADGFGGPRTGHVRRARRPEGCSLNGPVERPRAVMRQAPGRREETRIAADPLRSVIGASLERSARTLDAQLAAERRPPLRAALAAAAGKAFPVGRVPSAAGQQPGSFDDGRLYFLAGVDEELAPGRGLQKWLDLDAS